MEHPLDQLDISQPVSILTTMSTQIKVGSVVYHRLGVIPGPGFVTNINNEDGVDIYYVDWQSRDDKPMPHTARSIIHHAEAHALAQSNE